MLLITNNIGAKNEEILQNSRFNGKATSAIKKWMAQTVKDHKDYGFNTIPYHRQLNIPDEYFEELEIFYFGKIKTGIIHANRVKSLSHDGKFPDVFSEEFKVRDLVVILFKTQKQQIFSRIYL